MRIMRIHFHNQLIHPVNLFSGLVKTLGGFLGAGLLVSCEKDFDINIKANQPQLVVEGYINNEFSQYNYVVLSRSMDYYQPDFQSVAVSNAIVHVTEGELVNDSTYNWDPASKVQLVEANLPQVPLNFRQGVYFDPRLISDSSRALKGTPGKHYLLEIEAEGRQYSSVTALLPTVVIDSLTSGYSFADTDDDYKEKARITLHFKDPDTLGNAQLVYWKNKDNRDNFGWGGMAAAWRNYGVDDLTNGQYMHVTQNRAFEIGDTVSYYMASVTRDVYNFWESFRNARNNEGPFATPVTLTGTIKGENVTGCFSGMSMSSKTIIVSK